MSGINAGDTATILPKTTAAVGGTFTITVRSLATTPAGKIAGVWSTDGSYYPARRVTIA